MAAAHAATVSNHGRTLKPSRMDILSIVKG
jgi:hypothetical protein